MSKHDEISRISDRKAILVSISKEQRKSLSRAWLYRHFQASKLVYEGVKACGPLSKLPASQGNFSELIDLKFPTEFFYQLEILSNENGVSVEEAIRRIIDEANRLLLEEQENIRKIQRPFSTAYGLNQLDYEDE